jgi:hypothetical protein
VRVLVIALLAALPWLVVWPALLYLRDPSLFQSWFWDDTVNRYLPIAVDAEQLAPPTTADFWLRTWPWFTFPAALLALLTPLVRVRDTWSSGGVRVALVASLVGWGVLLVAPYARELYGLPLLAPLAVIAAGGVSRLPRLIVTPAYLLTVLVFGALATLLWALWIYHMYTGQPLQHGVLAEYLPMEFDFVWHPVAFITAAFFTLFWIWIAMRFRAPRPASLLAWPAGVIMLWGLVALLHLPWFDAAVRDSDTSAHATATMPARSAAASGLVEAASSPAGS